ncbi:MAG: transporter substrate-binding domain-containing protein [Hyphomicrobiaceae bacterium]|nr:transporter substrate-binding domain-containing protein [Hyphomicrobiaceae bacterium]
MQRFGAEGDMRRRQHLLIVMLIVLIAAGGSRLAAQSPPPESSTAEEATRRLVLRFLTDGDFPPFNYFDEEGVLTGFNVDLARAICLETNTSCDIQVRPWDTLMHALNRGDADAVIAGHKVSATLLRSVDFTERYFHTPARFAGRRDAEQVEITPEDLDGKRIGVARGTAHEAYLKAFFRYSVIRELDSPELARDALTSGEVDLVFDDGISLGFWVAGTASRECCELKGGAFHEPKFFGDGLAIAVPKRDQQLKSLINQALKRVRASGRYEELVLRYFPIRIY